MEFNEWKMKKAMRGDLYVTNVTNVANTKRGFGKPIERKHIAGRRGEVGKWG